MDKSELKMWVSSLIQNDDLLVGKIEPSFFNQKENIEVAFCIDPDNPIISIVQLSTFEKYLNNRSRIHAEMIDRIYSYYQSVVEKYRIAFLEWGDNPDENAPVISKSDELSILLKYQGLFFPNTDEAGDFGLAFGCKWEIEHGLGLRYVNWIFKEIGDNDTHWNF